MQLDQLLNLTCDKPNTNGQNRCFLVLWKPLPACRRLLFPLLQAEKGRLRNAVANRVPASCWVPKILGTRCDRLTHSVHCLT